MQTSKPPMEALPALHAAKLGWGVRTLPAAAKAPRQPGGDEVDFPEK